MTAPIRQRFAAGILAGVALLFVGLAGRLVYINTVLSGKLLEIAERQYEGSSVMPARRGMILDARGRVLATSRRMPNVFVDPYRVSNPEELASQLGARLNLPAATLLERILGHKDSRFLVLATGVDEEEADAVVALKNPAVGITEHEARTYPLGTSMAHVLGFVGRDGGGLEGVERYYDDHLRGKDGRRELIMDARRRALWHQSVPTQLPLDGGHLVLTLDAEIQRITEQVLAATIMEFDAISGTAIVMSPADGDILAMALWPSYDPNEGSTVPSELRRNRALTDPNEPGSVFKPFIACGALDGRFISATDQIDCNLGECKFGTRTVKDTSPHGLMDLAGIMTHSSNIGMAKIGQRMGNRALYDTVRRFGFGEPTGIDCPGEGKGKIRPLRRWSSSTAYSAASVGMGYEVSVTPIQLITAFCGLINEGKLVRPRLAKKLLGPDGTLAQGVDSDVKGRQATTRESARYIGRELLASVVEQGTGRRAQLERYRVLGKTGTPKLLDAGRRRYEAGAYQPTFIGAAPVSDPQVAVVVMIHRPNASRGYYGGVVAAPAAAKILDWTLDYLGIPPDRTTMLTGL